MKKIIALFIAAIAVLAAAPQSARAQASGDILLIQRTGTTNVSLLASGSGSQYVVMRSGSAALTSGSCTITDARVSTGSIFTLTGVGTTAAGTLAVGTINSGTNFQIVSTSGSDARVVHWFFLRQ